MWERADFEGGETDSQPEPHICERGQLKFNGGAPVYLCRTCRVILCYEDGTPYG